MKLKYYLRGLGIGIVVTAVVLSGSSKGHIKELTDAQIKAKAKELGMVEESLLSDVLDVKAETKEEAAKEEVKKEEAKVEESVSDNSSISNNTISNNSISNNSLESETKSSDEAETENKAEVSQEKETIIITVASGESSVSICKKLEAAGLIDSASEYDKYLCQNGYDKRICTGNHSISKGATKEEIAKKITSR